MSSRTSQASTPSDTSEVEPPDPAKVDSVIESLRSFIEVAAWAPGEPEPDQSAVFGMADQLWEVMAENGYEERWLTDAGDGPKLVAQGLRRLPAEIANVMGRGNFSLVDGSWMKHPDPEKQAVAFASPIDVRRMKESLRCLVDGLARICGKDLLPKAPVLPTRPEHPFDDLVLAIVHLVELAEVADDANGWVTIRRRIKILWAFNVFDASMRRFRGIVQGFRSLPGGQDLDVRSEDAIDLIHTARGRAGWHLNRGDWDLYPRSVATERADGSLHIPGLRLLPDEAGQLLLLADRAKAMAARIKAQDVPRLAAESVPPIPQPDPVIDTSSEQHHVRPLPDGSDSDEVEPANLSSDILPEFRTKPLTLTKAARFLGISGNKQKPSDQLKSIMKEGNFPYDKLGRQSYVFDIRKFPKATHERIRPS